MCAKCEKTTTHAPQHDSIDFLTCCVGFIPVIANMGTLSYTPSSSPVVKLVAPGPLVAMTTPSLPVYLALAAHIEAAFPSVRVLREKACEKDKLVRRKDVMKEFQEPASYPQEFPRGGCGSFQVITYHIHVSLGWSQTALTKGTTAPPCWPNTTETPMSAMALATH